MDDINQSGPLSQSEQPHATLPAKQPKTILAGPYGHPFHPVLVTVPIGAWVASVVFDIIALAGSGTRASSRKAPIG